MSACRVPPGLGTTVGLVVGLDRLANTPATVLLPFGAAGLLLLILSRRLGRRPGAAAGLAAVILLAAAAGGLRAPSEDGPPPAPCDDALLVGRILDWEARPFGVTARIGLVRAGRVSYPEELPVRLLAPPGWAATPQSAWIALRGSLRPDRGPTNPGAWSDRRARGTVRPSPMTRAVWGPGPPPRLFRWRAGMARRARDLWPGFAGRFAVGVLLGRSSALEPAEREVFRRTGTSHLVAVSGLHVGLLASLALLALGSAPRGPRLAGVAAAVWGYAALAGWSPSAVRAATLVSLHGAGGMLHRPRSSLGWLSLALPWLLWVDPVLLGSVSFRLSVGAVGGILFFLELARPPASRSGRLLSAGAVCLGAQWGTLPTALATFGTVSPLALGPNLLAVPLTGLFLPAVLLALAASGLPVLGPLLRDAALGLGTAVGEILARGADLLPFLGGWSVPRTGALAAFPILLFLWFALPEARRRRRPWRLAAAAAAGTAVVLCLLPQSVPPGPWVAFLDVGQADASVFRLSDGTVWVVDTGDDRGPGDAARNAILPFLRAMHIREVDGLVLTHRHQDHVGALGPLLEGVSVRRVFGAGHGPSSGTAAGVDSILAAHARWLCLVAAGDTLHDGQALVTVLHPPRPDGGDPLPTSHLNDSSVITRVVDGPLSVLFAGDAETGAEEVALGAQRNLAVRILQVGHHGSATSSSESFIRAAAPEWAVVSVGRDNRYGHPDPGTLDRLRALGARIHRTDEEGALLLRPGPSDGWIVRTFPPVRADRGDSLSAKNTIW